MGWTIRRGSLATVVGLTTLFALVCAVGKAPAAVQPELAGVWLRDIPGPQGQHRILTMDIASEGTFRLWVGDELSVRESGDISTTPGTPAKYHLDFESGAKDDGTFELTDARAELHFINSTGTTIYKRAVPLIESVPGDMPLMIKTAEPSPLELIKRRSAVAQRLSPQAPPQGLPAVQIEKAAELLQGGHAADALSILQRTGRAWGRDMAFSYLAACVHLEAGDPLVARREFDRVLMRRPDLVPAYLGRALAAGRLGRVARMRADLAIARTLDPDQTADFCSTHKQQIDSIEASQPRETPATLRDRLLKAAKDGAEAQALLPTALDLTRAMNDVRILPEERFQDGLRLCAAAIASNPNDPQTWADLATYLYNESTDKFGHGKADGIEWVSDRILAMRFADQALKLDARNLTALATKAWLLEQDNQEKDALDLAKKGLALAPGYPRFAKLESILLNVSSIRAHDEAARQRAPKTWAVSGPSWITVYTRGPNEQELQAAQKFDGMSAGNVSQANEAEYAAWRRYKGSIAEMNVAAGYYDWIGQTDKAVELWNRVLKLDPRNATALSDLEDFYKDGGQTDLEFEMRFRLENVYATTARALTEKSSNELVAHDLDRANQDLSRALQTDPTDTLVYALLARSAMMTKDASAWWPYARCGEALALAAARLRDIDLSPDATGVLTIEQTRDILNIWDGELKVATHDSLSERIEHYQRLIDAVKHRLPAPVTPRAPGRQPTPAATAQQPGEEEIAVLVNDNEMEAAARACVSGESGTGAWHAETAGPIVDLEYPIYLYLRPRLYHYELWHYFGPGTLQTYEAYAQSHAGFDARNPPSRLNHPDAAR